ncbi:MAG TPA: aspartate dehydrogenase [Candidatus Bathyarchaeia archaeon]|nr:aspartate dehydrogenase [Candidatus Bathyarchaeia archaeon]
MSRVYAGLLGCGAIGRNIAQAIDRGEAGETELTVVYDVIQQVAEDLAGGLSRKPLVARSVSDVSTNPQVNLVIEAANQMVVREHIPEVLRNRKNLLIMSVGAFSDEDLFLQVTSLAKQNGVRVYIPSGAIAGLDALKAAAAAGLDEVSITTTKPPQGLKGAPYVIQKKINLENIKERTIIYDGTAAEAAPLFPANVNVALALSLAGLGPVKTKARVIADPNTTKNTHEIFARGRFGTLTVKIENVPFPTNPKTSWLAALSAIRKIREITETVSLGT